MTFMHERTNAAMIMLMLIRRMLEVEKQQSSSFVKVKTGNRFNNRK